MEHHDQAHLHHFLLPHRPRRAVLRQIKYLGPRHDLTVIGFGDADPAWDDSPTIEWRPVIRQPSNWGVRLSELALLTIAGYARPASYEHWYWRRPHHHAALEHASATPCDAYHANDWEALPVAVEAARAHGAKVVFDTHEYSPLEFEDAGRGGCSTPGRSSISCANTRPPSMHPPRSRPPSPKSIARNSDSTRPWCSIAPKRWICNRDPSIRAAFD